jgi:hypothetical protein
MGCFLKVTLLQKRLMKTQVVFMLKNLPVISIVQVDLTLIVDLIMDVFLRVSTFPRFNSISLME